MAKKKKMQLKPVARGFATTSVPKKVVELEKTEEAEVSEATSNQPDLLVQDSTASEAAFPAPVDEYDPDRHEEQSLQLLVERLQDKTEKEGIEQERRFSETMLPADLHSKLITRVMALARERQISEGKKAINESEDKALPRLAITYGVLRRLGFSEVRVEQCLRAIDGVDIDEALDWLYLHCTDVELGILNDPLSESISLGKPSLSATSSRPESPAWSSTKALTSGPTAPRGPHHPRSVSSASLLPKVEIQRDDPDDANGEYVKLKMQISELTTHRRPDETRDAAFLHALQKRLAEVQKEYTFDKREAEAQWRLERQKADAELLRARLRGDAPMQAPVTLENTPSKTDSTSDSNTSSTPAKDTDVMDQEDGDEGGMFDILEAMPKTEISETGITVTVRDMALPKHWSGKTPKVLLSEVVHKVDRIALISYRSTSGSSRAKRSAVSIIWEGGRVQDWNMDDIACHDLFQAEQYISTVAMHSLAYPESDGFMAGGSSGTAGQTTFRLLPGVYRDLWDQLEDNRKANKDTMNRSVWGKLRAILEPKVDSEAKSSMKGPRQTDVQDSSTPLGRGVDYPRVSETIAMGFRARQATPAYQEMLRQRSQLPIAQYRDDITAALDEHKVLVLCGETGCGKSTQVPSFLLEHELSQGRHCKIYCTEPRRISATSLAQRVSQELGEDRGALGTNRSLVGYAVRLENTIASQTRLAFVTNGIALRMLEGGSGPGGRGTAFDEITHIVIDEVHERTIESDFLLIVLKSLLQSRPDLKVILMSATVEAEKFSAYFNDCPVLYVPGRTFPVDVRFLEDAVEFTKWKITENSPYARRGRDRFNQNKGKLEWSEDTAHVEDDDDEGDQQNVKLEKRYSSNTVTTVNLLDERLIPYELIVRLLERLCFEDPTYMQYSGAVLVFMPGLGEIRRLNDTLMEHPAFGSEQQFKVYPLHSTISSENQNAVFDVPPPGIRKIVISTNIAETGITIPDITCVIDTGKHREMRFDEKRQISRLIETLIAKSNAAQRRGRAGRVQSGLCFHLFTKLRHDTKMAAHPDPEMMRLSLSDLALRIKIMKVKIGSSIEDVLSKALDPPLPINIQRAVTALVEVRALTASEEITPMGRLLSKLPTDVHLGKFLLIATLFRCLDPALTVVAALNSKSPFLTPFGLEAEADRAKLSFRVENSDFLTLHNAFASWRRACGNGVAQKFCRTSFLSHQNLQQIEELRQQFLGYLVDSSFIQVDHAFTQELSRARFSRGRTRFVNVPPELDANSGNVFIFNAALTAGLYPKILAIDQTVGDMRTITNNQQAYFHPSSVNFRKKPRNFGVRHLCYFTLMHSKKLYAWETGPVDDLALVLLCGDAEFKLASDIVYIDRKIKFRVTPRSSIALKVLREELTSVLATQMRKKPLQEFQALWNDLAMTILGKVKIPDPSDGEESVKVVIRK